MKDNNPITETNNFKDGGDNKPKKGKGKLKLVGICIFLSLVLGLSGGFIASRLFTGGTVDDRITQVVDDIDDCVVEIDTEKVESNSTETVSSSGSGIVISADGYIATNRHVLENSKSVVVTLKNSEKYPATLVGYDSDEDIAVVKIDKKGLRPVQFSDSSAMRVGQKTIVIGNALGLLEGTVSSGIISAKEREMVLNGETMVLFQTDAAINNGNSGGGIFDMNGKLLGMVVARSRITSSEGLGFGIPSNTVKFVTDQILKYGYVPGRIDLQMTLVQTDSGSIIVAKMKEGSNAESAGFKIGDIIKEVKHQPVTSLGEVDKIVDDCKVGEVIDFTIDRDGQESAISLPLAEFKPVTK